MKIQTPAKINPLLYILGKREDGFHELYMHMVPVSLYDTLTFVGNKKQGLNFQIKGASFPEPEEDNLVVRAVRAFEQVSRIKVNYDILLEKKTGLKVSTIFIPCIRAGHALPTADECQFDSVAFEEARSQNEGPWSLRQVQRACACTISSHQIAGALLGS